MATSIQNARPARASRSSIEPGSSAEARGSASTEIVYLPRRRAQTLGGGAVSRGCAAAARQALTVRWMSARPMMPRNVATLILEDTASPKARPSARMLPQPPPCATRTAR